ncbi:MAG: V-type ATP synthase subunit A [Candidatus Algichlamydia australiensis]|nr:V-type ATP synthase subunit A [Chlamydiales bacterium]
MSCQGSVVKAFGNLLHVKFTGNVRQGEVGFVEIEGDKLKAEVIEIAGDEAKLQVFEDMYDVQLGSPVEFTGDLLEAELGPGLISSIFDGLQNPLERVAEQAGIFLTRGVYIPPLDRKRTWEFTPKAKVGEWVERGDMLGMTKESRFDHHIMVPFSLRGQWKLTWLADGGNYTVDEPIAKITNEAGREETLTMCQKWPIKLPLMVGKKVKARNMMDTGLRILDAQFPVLKGGTFCSPGPFGAGKTVMQHHLSKYSSVDLVIVCACGERAGEVVEVLRTFPELTDPHTGKPLISRTVIICNTSSMPVAAREASVYLGATMAEYYRQMGLDVLLLADSTSRWAQAMREMSGRLEEIPGEEAFPAYLASRIASFYERSGVLELKNGKQGSLTIGGTVSPAGGNFEEPVTQASLSSVGAFHGLSRARSDARRYPAIDPLISWSKYLVDVDRELSTKLEGWGSKVEEASRLLRLGDEIGKRMEVVGEEGISLDDLILFLKSEVYEACYLQQNAFDPVDNYCPIDRQIELFKLMQKIFTAKFALEDADLAREYFLSLQSEIKNMNTLPYQTDSYNKTYKEIEEKIHGKSL